VLLTAGSVLTTIALAIAFTTSAPIVVRIGLMRPVWDGPDFPNLSWSGFSDDARMSELR